MQVMLEHNKSNAAVPSFYTFTQHFYLSKDVSCPVVANIFFLSLTPFYLFILPIDEKIYTQKYF